MNIHARFAELLNMPEEVVADVDRRMSEAGKSGIFEEVLKERDERVARVLATFGEAEFSEATRVRLVDEVLRHDTQLATYVKNLPGETDFDKAAGLARKIVRVGKGYFLKKSYAEDILRQRPPMNLLAFLGYTTVEELLQKHDVTEAFSALRFMESDEWMHKTFDAAYSLFTAADFEERDIELKVLGPEWHEVAKKFVEKKHHNVSHLKEFGVIFLNPIGEDTPGKFLRDFALLLHYFHEVEFYSKLFRKYAAENDFAERFKALLRGDVRNASDLAPGEWLIVQRYFIKIDPADPRLFTPRVNPESLHWRRGEMDLAQFAKQTPGLDLGFWEDLDWVGLILPGGVLASLDVEDNAMSAVARSEGGAEFMNYHQKEAIWTYIFQKFAGGEEAMEKLLIDNFSEGIIRSQ